MNESNWHRGDRVLHRPSGQRGIVEGWKGGKLLVFWGVNNKQEFRDWVSDEECVWEPAPLVQRKAGSTELDLRSLPSGSSTNPT